MMRRIRTSERGSVSLWLVIFTLTSFVLLTFIVDGGQYMNARERAADIAEQAARAGADTVSVAGLRQGTFTIPQGACDDAVTSLVGSYAQDSLSASDQGGTTASQCQIDGPKVTVDVQVTVTPAIPVIFGTFSTGASESATLDCGTATTSTGAC
jgi:Flp pilus assembly protein TadG